MPAPIVINESLVEMQLSLGEDLSMIRNMRTALIKAQDFERVDSLRAIERNIIELIQTIASALP
jgi:hypothetical protein